MERMSFSSDLELWIMADILHKFVDCYPMCFFVALCANVETSVEQCGIIVEAVLSRYDICWEQSSEILAGRRASILCVARSDECFKSRKCAV